MNFRKNGGFAGIDISISLIILLIFIPTIFGISYNIQKNDKMIKRKLTAINIASNILEIAKSENYEEVILKDDDDNIAYDCQFIKDLKEKYTLSEYHTEEETDYKYIYLSKTGSNEEHYQIQIGLKNCYPVGIADENKEDLVKKIKVKVYYPVGNTIKTVNMDMMIQNT